MADITLVRGDTLKLTLTDIRLSNMLVDFIQRINYNQEVKHNGRRKTMGNNALGR